MKKRYEIAGIGQIRMLSSQSLTNQETIALQNFCKQSLLFKTLKELANASGANKERNTLMLYSIKHADNFIKALDIVKEAIEAHDALLRTGYYVLSFFMKSANFEWKLPNLHTELAAYALRNGFEIESKEAVYSASK